MLRGIAALSCVVIAIGFLVAANHNPWLIVFTVAFAVLGLWIAGRGIGSRFARLQTPEEIAKEELEIRNGPFFGVRNRLLNTNVN